MPILIKHKLTGNGIHEYGGNSLSYANLSNADLSGANLSNAYLDFSSGMPLWCGGTEVKLDEKQIIQILWHAGSNMQAYMKENKNITPLWLRAIFKLIQKNQDKFHRISKVKWIRE